MLLLALTVLFIAAIQAISEFFSTVLRIHSLECFLEKCSGLKQLFSNLKSLNNLFN